MRNFWTEKFLHASREMMTAEKYQEKSATEN
jgi:hypothetical protein